ncbi:MAG: hypothetical protein JWR76_1925 [Mucilaginibacter sp.]|nr:hypothetical protein [Mucilaginibacter sp.]
MSEKITQAKVRMYRMGTGDCFIVKFYAAEKEKFTMMIDCGVWKRSAAELRPYMEDLKKHVNGKVDLLIVTHEHVDHVSVFDLCKDVFIKDFEVKKVWMAWTEDDSLTEITIWKKDHGEKKKALKQAVEKLNAIVGSTGFQNSIRLSASGMDALKAKESFVETLTGFAELHMGNDPQNYKGLLEGMRVVKEEIGKGKIEFLYPGDIIKEIPGLEGLRLYIMGPPRDWDSIALEAGGEGESYRHNNELKGVDAFAASVLSTPDNLSSILPFDERFETVDPQDMDLYTNSKNSWRKIEEDWLMSAGSLALRVNSMTNNQSLVLAIEAEDSKKVMLFPGDAEFGSWASWHKIDWKGLVGPNKIHYTQDLLNRTVFYKIAHHMSHNGTAQRQGLEMMNDPELTAMATLDYNSIAAAWKNTMPNRAMLKELLVRTKGRVIIMNEDNLFYDFNEREPLTDKIKAARMKMTTQELKNFQKNLEIGEKDRYFELTVNL